MTNTMIRRYCAAAAALLLSIPPLTTIAQVRNWPPLVKGADGASFKATYRVMSDYPVISLSYGLFGMQNLFLPGLGLRSAPLADILEDAKIFQIYEDSRANGAIRMLGAVFFLVSLEPDIVVAVPDNFPDSSSGLVYQRSGNQKTLDALYRRFHLAEAETVVYVDCPDARNPGCAGPSRQRPERNNAILVTRLILNRPGTWIATEAGAQPLPEDRTFQAGSKTFRFVPVEGQPDMLQLQAVR